jgi:hypothetical protein
VARATPIWPPEPPSFRKGVVSATFYDQFEGGRTNPMVINWGWIGHPQKAYTYIYIFEGWLESVEFIF